MADPTPAEVAAAIATLEAFEHAQHPVAAPVEPSCRNPLSLSRYMLRLSRRKYLRRSIRISLDQ